MSNSFKRIDSKIEEIERRTGITKEEPSAYSLYLDEFFTLIADITNIHHKKLVTAWTEIERPYRHRNTIRDRLEYHPHEDEERLTKRDAATWLYIQRHPEFDTQVTPIYKKHINTEPPWKTHKINDPDAINAVNYAETLHNITPPEAKDKIRYALFWKENAFIPKHGRHYTTKEKHRHLKQTIKEYQDNPYRYTQGFKIYPIRQPPPEKNPENDPPEPSK